MAKQAKTTAKKTKTAGAKASYSVWRGGQKILLEKLEDRYTIIPSSSEHLTKIKAAPGVRAVKPLSSGVYKVETTTTDRDASMDAVRSSAFDGIAHHAYKPADSDGTVYYLTDKIIVAFKPNTKTAQIEALLKKYSLKLLKEYDPEPKDSAQKAGSTYLVQVTSSSGANPIKISNQLAEEKGVVFAEPNMVNRFMRMFTPNDPLFRRQWHLDAFNGPHLVSGASVQAPKAWDITRGSRDIVVAVIDDGFDLNHPDFGGAGKVVQPRDYVDGDANPFPAGDDYHGTPCAGVAIAESNGRGVVGVAHGCAFMPIRFPLAADDDTLINVFEEAARYADVISCSWGPPPVHAPLPLPVSQMFTRITTTGGPKGKGVVVCFAAGNFNAPLRDKVNLGGFNWRDGDGLMRTTTGPILNGFATHPNVICVAASTSLNQHSAYSNWGAEVSGCAPSDNFHPLKPQAFVPGRGIWTTDNEAFGRDFTTNSRYTSKFGGTSSATPLTAGVAALMLSANPNLTAQQVKQILQETADKIVDAEPDVMTGANRGNYNAQGHCHWFGYGKVNAAKAVARAKGLIG